MSEWYNSGTLAAESGSASIVGTDTLFMTRVKDGDMLVTFQGGTLRLSQVVSRDDDNHLAIEPAWEGDTASGLAYYVVPTSTDWGQVSKVAADLATFLSTRASFFPTEGKPAEDLGGNGSFAIDQTAAPPLLYSKSAGSWDDGTSLGGPKGDTGKGYGGTSTDSKTLAASGSMTFTVQAGLAWLAGSRIRIASAAAPTTKWMEGSISSYIGTSLVVTIDKQGSGSGSASDWIISPAGIPGEKGDTGATGATGAAGSTGATGAGYGGTSTTSRAIGSSGTMTWNIGTGYAYQNGDLVKIVSTADGSKWMKGKISGYSAGVLSVDIGESNGSGTLASWNIGLAGETGPTGATGSTGATGAAGSNGTDGTILTGTSATSITPATGDRTFTLSASANFLVNQRVRVASNATPGNFMSGLVQSWNSGTKVLIVTVDLLGSAPATAADWNISVTGEKGDQGPAGGFGALLTTKGNWPLADGSTFGALSVGADGSLPLADSAATYGVSWTALSALLAGGYWSQSTIPSAATCDIGAMTTPYVAISGSTAITSLGVGVNKFRIVEFTGSLVLTYNGTSLVLPGLANIITQAGDKGIFVSDASGNWKCVAWTPLRFLPKEVLTANRTYYVRTDGSDSNNGLTNTAGGAFLTIQKAVDVVASLDLSIFNAIIQCGPGTRTSPIILKRTIGSGMPILLGDTTTPANCTIDVTSAQCITLDTAAVWTMRGFKLQTTTGGWCVDIPQPGCHLIIDGNMEYGATPLFHFVIAVGGTLSIKAPYTISGSCYSHFFVQAGGALFYTPTTVTLTGAPAWTNVFINVTSGGIVSTGTVTFTGSATGKRYDVSLNGVINTFGQGANFFPGNSAGTAATGGQYA